MWRRRRSSAAHLAVIDNLLTRVQSEPRHRRGHAQDPTPPATPEPELGPWTRRVPEITTAELYLEVIRYATQLGWDLETLDRMDLTAIEDKLASALAESGQRTLDNALDEAILERLAARAVAHLNSQAPANTRYELTDGLYLLPATAGVEQASRFNLRWS